MHDELAESKGLKILAFPCNQFMGQEPRCNEDIKAFVTKMYGVKFDVFAKINVNGDKGDPLWKYLKNKQAGSFGNLIKWNYTKFLIDKEGQPVKRYGPMVQPKNIQKDIENYL
ncbi:hypothetical protein LSH36_28g02002 [Paralvinella palmiformis]|uniref:Glutathione peroxidase n=1 Tax=Paralvinella palmiformis TaxID=53620 RepID=A0AAD9NEK7_9ANNE|nr:hypothetical protein LSH36_28g02002 [Paralvinella palmiformis]